MDEKHDKQTQQRLQQLRAAAEALLAQAPAADPGLHAPDVLLHELQVHQIELEMQNEELRQAQAALEASRDRYVDLYEFAPIGYLTLSAEGLISEINLKAANLLGMERHKLLHRHFARLVADHDKDRWHRLFVGMKKEPAGQEQSFDLELARLDGSTIHARLNCLRMDDVVEPRTLRVALDDITQLKQAEVKLRIAAIVFECQESMLVTDANRVILRVNQAFTAATGYSAEEAMGQTPRLLKSGRHGAAFYDAMWDSIRNHGVWKGEIWNRRKNGEVYPVWLTVTALLGNDGEVSHYVATMTDISEAKAASAQIEHLAFYDALTQLPNRRLLMDRLHQALVSSTRDGRDGALLLIDLDNFKSLNDTLGHDLGDLLLQQVAQRLVGCVRECDTVARLGGDEFVVLLEDLSPSSSEAATQAEVAVRKIQEALGASYQLAGHEWRCTPSIGITLFQDQLFTVEELLKRIDIAMYQAKQAGRNALRFFDQEMQTLVTARTALETDLRQALENDQFRLHYQIQTTQDGHAIGAEVLIRWQHPQRGLMIPEEFIPLSEETGLILPIGLWVLETACAQLKSWAADPLTRQLHLAVNISIRQFHQHDFVAQVLAIVKAAAINPSLLTLELTESLVLDDIDDTILKMNALRETGLRFAMDDFGTGYSSLAYLTQLPLAQLKIDRSFVHNIGVKQTDAIIVQTIIGMAKNLEMEVIAEGVETEEQRLFLEQHGCLLCQGYHFSRPRPIAEFEALLRQGTA